MQQPAIRIIGIDPGLRITGWGVIEVRGPFMSYVAGGEITSGPQHALADRLRELHDGLIETISEYRPMEAAVEEIFVNRDPRSALKLGQARAVALLAPALAGLSVAEYPANVVKKTVTGSGHAEKVQISLMVHTLLQESRAFSADAADALAVAITHARFRLPLI